ncbi:hypothetical protein AMECASPLE_011533 [Ameca splendens]|uniref:Uncharacterized protein n=1 Tax=Ameca splendens TaxID=208324 RepID=A0ABV1A7Z1_9TELE
MIQCFTSWLQDHFKDPSSKKTTKGSRLRQNQEHRKRKEKKRKTGSNSLAGNELGIGELEHMATKTAWQRAVVMY